MCAVLECEGANFHVNLMQFKCVYGGGEGEEMKEYKSGARFTKHLKPKIFLSAIQFVWHLRKS